MESLYGSWKRAKAPSSSSSAAAAAAGNNIPFPPPPQVAHCLVDGCNADLSLCRDYHRRHKVCEMHSKTCRVTIGGRSDQRFCQQCSRFHSLVEFDEGKRSCRKRLDGHNRRRRKPHPNSTGLTTTTLQKAQMLSTNSVNSSCDIMLYNNSSNNPHQIHRTQNALSECSSAHNNSSNNTVFTETISNRLNNQVVDCDRALSLLSSAYYQQVVRVQTTPEHLFPQSMQYTSTTGLLGHDEYDDLYKYIHHQENKAADSHPSMLHFPEMVRRHDHHEGSSTSEGGSRQTHTFMWE